MWFRIHCKSFGPSLALIDSNTALNASVAQSQDQHYLIALQTSADIIAVTEPPPWVLFNLHSCQAQVSIQFENTTYL